MTDLNPMLAVTRAYLETASRRIALVFDADSRDALHAVVPTAGFPKYLLLVGIDDVDEILRDAPPVDEWVTFSRTCEWRVREILASKLAASGLKSPAITSVLNDLLVADLGDLPVEPTAASHEVTAYAIVCTPRCGSTYLAQLLGSAGFGFPKEHLRTRESDILARSQLSDADAIALLTAFMQRNQKNNVFGTKLVSHFLFAMLQRGPLPTALTDFIRARFSVIHLIRQDKAEQAISDYLAKKTGVWHVLGGKSSAKAAHAHQTVEYSFEAILKSYNFMIFQDRRLTKLLKSVRHRVMFYEDIVADPAAGVAGVAAFLNLPVVGEPSSRVVKIERSASGEFRERFGADFKAHFGISPEEDARASMVSRPVRRRVAAVASP